MLYQGRDHGMARRPLRHVTTRRVRVSRVQRARPSHPADRQLRARAAGGQVGQESARVDAVTVARQMLSDTETLSSGDNRATIGAGVCVGGAAVQGGRSYFQEIEFVLRVQRHRHIISGPFQPIRLNLQTWPNT